MSRTCTASSCDINHDQRLRKTADALLEYTRTGRGLAPLLEALTAQADDPRQEVRAAVVCLAADIRPTVSSEFDAQFKALLEGANSDHLSPGGVIRPLDRLLDEAVTEGEREALSRFAVGARLQLRQTYPVTKETIVTVVAGIEKLDTAALASCDQFASETGPGSHRLVADLLLGPGRVVRPEWKAACDASLTALEVFKRLEPKLPPKYPWWRSWWFKAALVILAVFLLGLFLGAKLFRPAPPPAEVRTEQVVVYVPVPVPDKAPPPAAPKPAPPAPVAPPLAVRKVVVIAPESLSKSLAGRELMARVEGLLHTAGPREKDKPGPLAEVVPYATTPTASWLPSDFLTDPDIEPVVLRLSQLNLLAGADHAAIVRPLRKDADALVATVTLVALTPAPAPKVAPAEDAMDSPTKDALWVETATATRVWSDVWHLPGLPEFTKADAQSLRVGLAAAQSTERGQLIAEVLWRQSGATADDYATAAAYYLAGRAPAKPADMKSADVARAREILWTGYTRFRSEQLARLLIGMERLPNRVALLGAHPDLIVGPDRKVFTDSEFDEAPTAATTRLKWTQTLATKLLGEVLNGRPK